jgi:hypothetical protein
VVRQGRRDGAALGNARQRRNHIKIDVARLDSAGKCTVRPGKARHFLKRSRMKDKTISIPGVQKKRFDVKIVGDTSLLSNRFSDEAKKKMRHKQQKIPTGARPAKDPEAEYKGSIYRTEDNQPGFPASGIKKACVSACRFIDDLPMTRARGAFYVMGKILPIDGEPVMSEEIVRLHGRTADLRYRAEYLEWSITLTILHSPRVISQESIVNLLETAGFHVGLGDWRPETGGTNGLFHVKRGG